MSFAFPFGRLFGVRLICYYPYLLVSTFGFLTHGNIAHCTVVTFHYDQNIYSTDIINIKGNIV
jgi:hypothetical protein